MKSPEPKVFPRHDLLFIFLLITLLCVPMLSNWAAPGPGLIQTTFTPAEVGTEIFRFSNSVVGSQPTMIEYQHGYLFIGSGGDGTKVKRVNWFNVSNPRTPQLISNVEVEGNKSHMAAFWSDRMLDGYQGNSMRIWDYDDKVVANTYSSNINPVWYMGQIPYVYRPANGYGSTSNSLEISDIRTGNGTRLANLDLGPLLGFKVGALHAIGNLLVCSASQAAGVATFDISDPAAPVLLDRLVKGRGTYTSMVHGNRVYQAEAGESGGVRVFDFSDPRDLREIGFIPITGSNPRYLMLKDGKGYITPGSSQLIVFNAETLEIERTFTLPGGSDFVYPIGNMAFLGGSGARNRTSIVALQEQPDSIGPKVTFASPANGAVSQGLKSRVGFIMSEPIDVTSLNTNSFIVRRPGGPTLSGIYSTQMGMINFTPDVPLLNDTTYEVVLPAGGIRDSVGNPMGAEFSMLFSTGATLSGQDAGVDGTLAHWRLNKTASDVSGNNRPLALFNGATFVSGAPEGSHFLRLDGADDYGDAALLDPGNRFTLSAWVQIAADRTNSQTILANAAGAVTSNGFKLYVHSAGTTDGRICFVTGNGTSSALAHTTDGVLVPGAWNHVAVVVNRTTGVARIFHNGVDRTATSTCLTNFATNARLNAGRMLDGAFPLGGNLDDVRIYPQELSAAQLADLSIGGLIGHWKLNASGVDDSGFNRTASLLNGAAYSTESQEGTHSVALDGNLHHLSGGTLDLGNAFTIALQARVPIGANNIQTFAANSVGGSNTAGFRFFLNEFNTTNGQIILETGNGTTGASIRSATGIWTPDTWNHVAVSVDRAAGTARLYLRGMEVATGPVRTDFLANAEVLFGAMGNQAYSLKGNLDDVRIYGRVLTAPEITTLATGRNTPPSELTLVTTRLSHTVGQSAQFTAHASDADSGTTLLYSFDFGDGSPATAFSSVGTASHTFTAPGRYNVIVRVTDGVATVTRQFTSIVHYPLTPTAPTVTTQILFDPARNKVWTVNPDSDTVSRLDAGSLSKDLEIPVGQKPRALALRPDGNALWVVCEGSSELWSLNPSTGAVLGKIKLGYGYAPVGVAFAPNGSAGFVALGGAEGLLKLNSATLAVEAALDLGAAPGAVAVSGDSSRVLVSRFISPDTQGEVWEVNPSTLTLIRTMALAFDPGPDTENSSRGVPNYLVQVAITPDGRRAWVPSKKDNIARGLFRDGQALGHDNTVRSILSQLDLGANAEAVRLDVDNQSLPGAICFSPRGDLAFVSYQFNNEVLVFDTATGANLAGVPTGATPQGLCVSPDGTRLFVHDFLSRTVSVFDVSQVVGATSSQITLLAQVPVVAAEKLPPDVLAGKQLFYNANDARMSAEGYLSCAACHLEGGQDGRTWDFGDRGEGLRNNIDLRGRRGPGQGRVHWSGNFDEIQDFEHDMRGAFGGFGFMTDAQFNTGTRNTPLGDAKAGVSPELDALAAYLASLNEVPSSPFREGGEATASALRGREVFVGLNCQQCHSGLNYTDSAQRLLHNIGTLKPSSGGRLGGPLTGIDTPTLRGIWNSAPYLHDGSAPTLDAVFETAHAPEGTPHASVRTLSASAREDLLNFLLELDQTQPVTTLSVTPAGLQNMLVWDTVDALSYTVLRSTTLGGTTTTLASGITSTSHTDFTATPGTLYYYTVVAVFKGGSSASSVPVAANALTVSNRASGGTATASKSATSATTGANSPAQAFDGSFAPLSGNKWWTGGSTTPSPAAPQWIQYQFASSAAWTVTQYTVTSADTLARDPRDWTFQGSADGITWTILDTQVGQAFSGRYVTKSYTFANVTPYAYYRLHITANAGETSSNGVAIAELELRAGSTAPAAPTTLAAVANHETQITLSWTDNATDETAYVIERSARHANLWTTLSSLLPANTAAFTDATATPATSYDYRVIALNGSIVSGFAIVAAATPATIGDGIPGAWRYHHFGNGTAILPGVSGPNDNPDGDDLNNLQEYLAGTDPRSAASTLKARLALTGSDLKISFTSVSGKSYRLERTSDLSASPWPILVRDNIVGTGGSITVTDPGAALEPRVFYRIKLKP